MPVVLAVVDLHFVALVHGHPRFGGLFRNANEHAGVAAAVVVGCAINDPDHRVADFLARVPQQAHAADGFEHAVFDHDFAGADVLPAIEIAAVEQRLPFRAGG